jgi:hypothetical protein
VRSRHTVVAAALAVGVGVLLAVALALALTSSERRGAGSTRRHPPANTAATAPPTTVDPGTLPQERILPSAGDPALAANARLLWKAIVDGNPAEAMPFFFPLSAYIQVKGIADPVHDWQTRLAADFDADVMSDHAALGPDPAGAQFGSVSVPADAVWVLPGAEYNKGSYYRVYGTTLHYTAGGQARSFGIASMISWRGQWYVVHLASIR